MDTWIGFDLDGTLALQGQGVDPRFLIGYPIPTMVERVKRLLEAGHTVKIFTARMSDSPTIWQRRIGDWTAFYIGTRLEATNQKDYGCIRIYDDIAISVEHNEGTILTQGHDELA
jgi:hypothetical protein